MIKVNDLRFGNLFTIAHESNSPIVKIAGIQSDNTFRYIIGNEEKGCLPLSWLIPISLNEEFLLKLGFENPEPESWVLNNFDFFYALPNSKIPHHLNYKGVGIWASYGHNQGNNFYVHEFQNLYFAITGKELEIK